MKNEIKITINGKEMTMEEAKDLYIKLKGIFGSDYTFPSNPNTPWNPPLITKESKKSLEDNLWPVTSSGTIPAKYLRKSKPNPYPLALTLFPFNTI